MNINVIYSIIIVLLIFCSAFFSCVETAFSCANTIRLKGYKDAGNKKAKRALHICDNYDKALIAILIGNNIVNLGCSSIATVLCINLFGNAGAAVATGLTTLLVLTFGEITPKCFGKEKSDTIVMNTAPILTGIIYVLYPLIYVFIGIKTLALKAANIKNSEPSVTEDELKYIIESIEEEGVLEEQESELVQSALEFDEKSAKDILTPRVDVTAIDINQSFEDIKKIVFEERYSRIPVYKGKIDNIIGVLHTRDFLEKLANGEKFSLEKIISPVYFVYKTKKLSAILNDFKKNKLHIAVVTDEYGGMLGIVTMEDLIEEIVGDIWDEDEEIESLYNKTNENMYVVNGDLELYELFELFDIDTRNLKVESVSVGGFVFENLGTIPKKGDSFVFKNLKFTVDEVAENRIISVKVEKIAENDDDND